MSCEKHSPGSSPLPKYHSHISRELWHKYAPQQTGFIQESIFTYLFVDYFQSHTLLCLSVLCCYNRIPQTGQFMNKVNMYVQAGKPRNIIAVSTKAKVLHPNIEETLCGGGLVRQRKRTEAVVAEEARFHFQDN